MSNQVAQPIDIYKVDPEIRLYFRDAFRHARAIAQQDAEGFQQILFTLETLGVMLTGRTLNLGKYEDYICDMADKSPLAEFIPSLHCEWHSSFDQIYSIVREARNEALHQGAVARHLTQHAILLSRFGGLSHE
jgi:hypothetical protein